MKALNFIGGIVCATVHFVATFLFVLLAVVLLGDDAWPDDESEGGAS